MALTILVVDIDPSSQELESNRLSRTISDALQRDPSAPAVRFVSSPRPSDLRRALLLYDPDFLHLRGRGRGSELMFTAEDGSTQVVESRALAELLRIITNRLQCVVLDSCYSASHAEAIRETAPSVVGIPSTLNDQARLEFLSAFYDAIAAGVDVAKAFSLGENALSWSSGPEDSPPVLYQASRNESPARPTRVYRDGSPSHLSISQEGPPLVAPEPPDELIQACLNGNCVLYAGAGLSAQSGFPTWTPFLEMLLNWAKTEGLASDRAIHSLAETLWAGEEDLVADNIVRMVDTQDRKNELHDYLRKTFDPPDKRDLPDPHRQLQRIHFAAALTTNLDSLLEQNFRHRLDHVLTPHDPEGLLNALSHRQFFLLKLYGDLEQPDTLLVAPSQYEDSIVGNQAMADFMSGLFVSRTIFFIGASLDGIRAYLEGIRFRGSERRHYALVAVSGSNVWEAKANQLKGRYGIEVLPYRETPEHQEFHAFLKQLADRTSDTSNVRSGSTLGTTTRGGGSSKQSRADLRWLRLENIGGFEDFELELDANWNVLLGDNGVGKSTILKAIALAFCGRDAGPYADRLLSRQASQGRILLRTERQTYTTILSRTSSRVDISSLPDRPLESEGRLALGFPPLRAISWRPPKASARDSSKERPTPADLLPLLTGEPDPRLDDLKDWIVNLDFWAQKTNKSDASVAKIRAKLFAVLQSVTDNLDIQLSPSIDVDDLLVSINGREVPIGAISQGTASLFGWLGVVMRRLYRIHGHGENALTQPALVMIDEIDAHMHPGWQQSLILKLREHFPAIQFIATTHSPLIVGGLSGDQVFRLEQNEQGRTELVDIPADMMLGRADQVLTGQAFGLQSTLDATTLGLVEEYQTLAALETQTTADEARLIELESLIPSRIPPTGETPAERRAQQLLNLLLQEQLDPEDKAVQKRLMLRAEQLIDAVSTKRKTRP